MKFLGILGIVAVLIGLMLVPAEEAKAAIPPTCALQVDGTPVTGGDDPEQILSGTGVQLDCAIRYSESVPYWIVLRTDGDPARWEIERLNDNGQTISQTTHGSPEVILVVGNYNVHLESDAPSVVEVLTQASGLRQEIARPQVKSIFTAEVRTAPAGTNVVSPNVEDLAQRVATLADIKTTVVHPFYATAQQELEQSKAEMATLEERYGSEWVGLTQLESDMQRADEAFETGQLDRVHELATLIQRYAEEEAVTASQIGELDAGRMVALRAAIITGSIALGLLAVAGAGVYIFVKRHSLFGSEDSYEYQEIPA